MNEMVKRIAAALRETGGLRNPDEAEILACVAIEAMREPTEEMAEAGARALFELVPQKSPVRRGLCRTAMAAMVTAALSPS